MFQDLVTTTVYKPADILALTLGGTKRWPKTQALLAFARTHCNMTEKRAQALLQHVALGVQQAAREATAHMQNHPLFFDVGVVMLAVWTQGLNLSINPDGQPRALPTPPTRAGSTT